MDKAIEDFLNQRKAAWIENKIKPQLSESETEKLRQESDVRFSLDTWLPDAAKRAAQLSMVSHSGKFTHPRAKISAILKKGIKICDGFLRTANAEAELDILGNAAALDVCTFLSLRLADSRKIIDHLEDSSAIIKEQLKIRTADFTQIRSDFLKIKQECSENPFTSGKIKQVYYPVAGGYHLLSILTSSGLLFELKDRIRSILSFEKAKEARLTKRNQQYSKDGFDELYNLVTIGYGGTKPQNISVLNSKNRGKAYLLPCLPPILQQRDIKLPKSNFFGDAVWASQFKDILSRFHKLLVVEYNNKNIREGRDRWIQEYVDRVIAQMWAVRQHNAGWTALDSYNQLSLHQKIWLDEGHAKQRIESDDWLDKVIDETARWFIRAYEKGLGKQSVKLGDAELHQIKSIVEQNREALR